MNFKLNAGDAGLCVDFQLNLLDADCIMCGFSSFLS